MSYINRPSANLQDCEDRKCPLLDGIMCRATNNDSCPPKNELQLIKVPE